MSLRLLTIDEAHATVSTNALRLLARCHTEDPFLVAAMLWGAGDIAELDGHDRRLARRHRQLLDQVNLLGYRGVAVDELEGIASAAGLDDDHFTRPDVP